jgi:hypothetical protein
LTILKIYSNDLFFNKADLASFKLTVGPSSDFDIQMGRKENATPEACQVRISTNALRNIDEKCYPEIVSIQI